MDLQSEKEELIEMFGIHFESIYHLSPLGARILALLILDGCKEGLTFESIVETMHASKSSVSTNLNLLLKMDKIQYYTISGDRKKHFKAAPFSDRLIHYVKVIEYEKKIIDKLHAYREKTVLCEQESNSLKHSRSYQAYVQKVEKLLLESIQEFKELENNNR
ncbi:GbsR/MarR family transcriptional regulator [Flavobacterium sp. TMP13]|uniref:GbsR/MarR family transcriptional regulator n=1 Tax=unclassified Flavobacterium TaxID=196869 RepID=UPI00076D3A1C|nr:hypothetical protein [Flavobacterium sp. TAB 87]KVV14738.1 hypothetical protein AP058_01791 [Flavobacterium sp. TAB 87]